MEKAIKIQQDIKRVFLYFFGKYPADNNEIK
jgi:hypothetical protein